MPDELPGATPIAPSSTPAPTPAPQPSAPPELPADAVVVMEDGRRARVADLITAAREHASAPKISADDAKSFDLFKRAQAGDAQALLEIAGVQQKVNEPPPDPIQEQYEQRIKTLEESLQRVAVPISQIETIKEQSQIKTGVLSAREKIPHLAHAVENDPGALIELHNSLRQAQENARQMGANVDDPHIRGQIAVAILNNAESRLERIASMYGGTWKPTAPPVTTATVKDANGNVIPNAIPGTSGPGTSLSPTSGTPDPNKKYTSADLLQQMKDRQAVLAGAV